MRNNRRLALPEDGPLPAIEQFFADQSLRLVVHQEPPPEPTPDEWRGMPRQEREATRRFRPPYWADLERIDTGTRVRWYGGGDSPDAAIRSARARWRVEQGD
jgi:hypothetical protein